MKREEVEALLKEADESNGSPSIVDCYTLAALCRAWLALVLLPDETDMIEHNPDEGMYMSCCGREVKSRGLYDLLVSHDDDCWYVRMQAMREQEDGK